MNTRRVRTSGRTYIRGVHLAYLAFGLAMLLGAATVVLPYPYHWAPFGLAIFTFFVVGAFKYPYVGLFGYLCIFFLDPNQIFSFLQYVAFPYEKLVAGFVLGSLAIHIAVVRKEFVFYKLDIAFSTLVLAAFVSILGAYDLAYAYEVWEMFLKTFIVYLLIGRIVRTEDQLKAIIILYILTVAFLAISSTIQYYRGEFEIRQGIQRLHSFGGGLIDPNTIATSMVLCIPFAYYMAKAHRAVLTKLIMLGFIGASLWAIILTGSRGGMVGAIAVMMLLVWHSRHKTVGFVVAAVVLACVAVVMPEQYQERFMTIFSIGADDPDGAGASAYGRINGLILGFKFLLKNPITGVGIGNFGFHHHLEPGGDWTDAHNLIGKLVGELGLLGIAAFSFFIYRFAKEIKVSRELYHQYGWDRDFLYYMTEATKIGLIMLFVQGMFGHNLLRDNWYFFAAFMVVIARLIRSRVDGRKNFRELEAERRTKATTEISGGG